MKRGRRTLAMNDSATVTTLQFNLVVGLLLALLDSFNTFVGGGPDAVAGFNALLAKLDGDGTIADDDFEAEHEVEAWPALVDEFNAVLAKLDADAEVNEDDYAALHAIEDFADFVDEFNAVLAKLDGDSGVTQTNFVATLALTAVQGAFGVVDSDEALQPIQFQE